MPELLLRAETGPSGSFKFTMANIGKPALNITIAPIPLRIGGMIRHYWRFSPVEYCTQSTPIILGYIIVGTGISVLMKEAHHQDLSIIAQCDPFGETFDEINLIKFRDTGVFPCAKIPLIIECDGTDREPYRFSFTLEYDRINQTIFCRREARL